MIVWPGLRRSVSAIRRLFNSASFYAPLTHSAIPTRAATGTTATFTRATTSTWPNNDGYLVTGVAGEIGFVGARRVRNLLRDTEGYVTGWTKTNTTVTTGVSDPFGGTSAATFTANAAAVQPVCVLASTLPVGTKVLNSVWLKRRTGTGTIQLLIADGTAYQTVAVTSTWTRFSSSVGTSLGAGNDKFAILISTSGDAIDVYAPQLEDVTAQTTQTAGEYVSVGVASAPYYHGSFVDGVKCFPYDINGAPIPSTTLLGYSAEGARTNLCLQSNAFTTTWAEFGTPAATQNVVGPDGATSAWTLTDNDAGAYEGVFQTDITLTAATYTLSFFVKKTVGAQSSYPVILTYLKVGTTSFAGVTVDTSNGVATAWTAYTGFTGVNGSATCVSYNATYWRVALTFTGTAAAWRVDIGPAGTTNPTQSTGAVDATAQGSAVFYGAQVEPGSFASSYIPTTTVAVKRNADVLTYSSSGNIDGTKGWAYAEVTMPTSVASVSFVAATGGSFPAYSSSDSELSVYDGTAERKFLPMTTSPAVKNIATTWGGTVTNASLSGTVGTSDGFDGNLDIGADLFVGIDSVSTSNLNGTIRNIRIGQRALSSSELQAVTA